MCFPATNEVAQAFAQDVRARFPAEVQRVTVVRTGRAHEWFPDSDVEVLVVAAGDPEELRPRVMELVSEYMWRDDVWVEVRVVEATPADELARERGAVKA
jgi:hypothetical protein